MYREEEGQGSIASTTIALVDSLHDFKNPRELPDELDEVIQEQDDLVACAVSGFPLTLMLLGPVHFYFDSTLKHGIIYLLKLLLGQFLACLTDTRDSNQLAQLGFFLEMDVQQNLVPDLIYRR